MRGLYSLVGGFQFCHIYVIDYLQDVVRFLPDAKLQSFSFDLLENFYVLDLNQACKSLAWVIAYLVFQHPDLPHDVQWYDKDTVPEIILARKVFCDRLLHSDNKLRLQPNNVWARVANNAVLQNMYDMLTGRSAPKPMSEFLRRSFLPICLMILPCPTSH